MVAIGLSSALIGCHLCVAFEKSISCLILGFCTMSSLGFPSLSLLVLLRLAPLLCSLWWGFLQDSMPEPLVTSLTSHFIQCSQLPPVWMGLLDFWPQSFSPNPGLHSCYLVNTSTWFPLVSSTSPTKMEPTHSSHLCSSLFLTCLCPCKHPLILQSVTSYISNYDAFTECLLWCRSWVKSSGYLLLKLVLANTLYSFLFMFE